MVITTGLLADLQTMAAHRPVAIQFINQFICFITCDANSCRKLYVEIQHDILVFCVVQFHSHCLLLTWRYLEIRNSKNVGCRNGIDLDVECFLGKIDFRFVYIRSNLICQLASIIT